MKNLRNLRKQHKLSQGELGKIFHAAQNTVSQWENGTKMPSCEIIEEIADYFDVTVDYLLGREEKKSPENTDDHYSEFLKTFNLLDDELKQKIIDYADFVRSRDADKEKS